MALIHKITTNVGDNELIDRYKATGDIAVLADLYQRYMELCFAVSIKYLKDPDNAKDAVMDVFEELGAKLKKHEVINFKSWLHTVVKNHCLMKLRKEGRNKTVNLDGEFMQLHDAGHQDGVNEKEWQLQQMTKCMDTLVAEQKRAVELFYIDRKCYNEISESTGLDWNKVRSLIQNGRRNLKICMEKAILSASEK